MARLEDLIKSVLSIPSLHTLSLNVCFTCLPTWRIFVDFVDGTYANVKRRMSTYERTLSKKSHTENSSCGNNRISFHSADGMILMQGSQVFSHEYGAQLIDHLPRNLEYFSCVTSWNTVFLRIFKD